MPRSRTSRRSRQLRIPSPLDTFPTANEIAERAHDLFVAEGRRVTRIFDYWQQAEQELLDLAVRKTLARTRR